MTEVTDDQIRAELYRILKESPAFREIIALTPKAGQVVVVVIGPGDPQRLVTAAKHLNRVFSPARVVVTDTPLEIKIIDASEIAGEENPG